MSFDRDINVQRLELCPRTAWLNANDERERADDPFVGAKPQDHAPALDPAECPNVQSLLIKGCI